MNSKFLLHFDLDNDLFRSEKRRDAIADALERTAKQIRDGAENGRVFDWNNQGIGFFAEVKG
jgi:hypothetical protein